jgi:hypothetical protein
MNQRPRRLPHKSCDAVLLIGAGTSGAGRVKGATARPTDAGVGPTGDDDVAIADQAKGSVTAFQRRSLKRAEQQLDAIALGQGPLSRQRRMLSAHAGLSTWSCTRTTYSLIRTR